MLLGIKGHGHEFFSSNFTFQFLKFVMINLDIFNGQSILPFSDSIPPKY